MLGDTFIAAVEAREYPVYATQFHPEKNPFEWRVKADHSKQGVEIAQFLANFFVQETRRNHHKFDTNQQVQELLIYNFEPVVPKNTSSFDQVYVFDNFSKETEVFMELLQHD